LKGLPRRDFSLHAITIPARLVSLQKAVLIMVGSFQHQRNAMCPTEAPMEIQAQQMRAHPSSLCQQSKAHITSAPIVVAKSGWKRTTCSRGLIAQNESNRTGKEVTQEETFVLGLRHGHLESSLACTKSYSSYHVYKPAHHRPLMKHEAVAEEVFHMGPECQDCIS
jgi:hypothetical protein